MREDVIVSRGEGSGGVRGADVGLSSPLTLNLRAHAANDHMKYTESEK